MSIIYDLLKPKYNDSVIMTPRKDQTIAETVRGNILRSTLSNKNISTQSQNSTAKTQAKTENKSRKSETVQKQEKPENKLQTSESTYSRKPLFGNTYDSESKQRERLQRFGIPTTDSSDAYQNGDTFKIIKEGGATAQDYLDFFEGFRSIDEDNPTGIKNNSLAPTVGNSLKRSRNSTKAVPHKNTSTASSRDERDARVREQYAAREKAERDAKYANYDIEAAEKKLNDYDYWTGMVIQSRKAGNSFSGDYAVLAERDALEAEIKAAKAAQGRNEARKYKSIQQEEDYAWYSSIGDGKVYISELDNPEHLRYATKDELEKYAYLKNKEGEKSANEYIKYLEPTLIVRKGFEAGEALAEGGAMMYVPYRGYAGLENYVRSIEQLLTDEVVPLSATAYANQYLSENTKGIGKLAGDVSFGIGNIAPSLAASALHPALGKISFGASSYGSAYNNTLLSGADKSEARTYAALKTASDVAMQHILGGISSLGGSKSLSGLTKSLANKMDNVGLRLATQLGGNMFAEGTEEGLQTYIDAGLRNVILDENNNIRDVSEDALYNSLLGAIEAFIIETPGAVMDTYMADSGDADIVVSGARITDPESKEAYDFANSYYEEVRHFSTDAQKVSENIGISYEEALQIKNYLFVDNSQYDDESGMWVPFDADCAIAHSWQRLMAGKDIKPHDRTLILHELYEMEIKRKNKGISHEKAHEIATRKYNYRRESDEYYVSLKKYKEER